MTEAETDAWLQYWGLTLYACTTQAHELAMRTHKRWLVCECGKTSIAAQRAATIGRKAYRVTPEAYREGSIVVAEFGEGL